jgi:hypothetical protein
MGDVVDAVHALLTESLRAWHVAGNIDKAADGTLLLGAGGIRLGIARAAPGGPFRWMVSADGRTRGVTSIAGVLRAVRVAIDPAYRPSRVRFAPQPVIVP